MNFKMSICLAFFLLVPFFLEATEKDLLLIGGGLKICSSFSTKNCSKPISYNENAYTKSFYRVLPDKIKTIAADQFQVFQNDEMASNILSLLNKYTLRFNQDKVTRRQLLKRLDSLKLTENQMLGSDILDQLNAREWNFVFHSLSAPVINEAGKALTEFVNLDYSDSDSVAIISNFVSLTKRKSDKHKPLILVSTSSASNSFDAVSFYLQLFGHYDVDVAWLPLDANLSDVLSDSSLSCKDLSNNRAKHYLQFDRERIYPQLTTYQKRFCENPGFIEELISRASGIFFNGGDQYLALSAFSDVNQTPHQYSMYYRTLKKRFDQGKLVVAGTSAGSAVQSGGILLNERLPMVTNGPALSGLFTGAVATKIPPSKLCSQDKNCENSTSLDSLTYLKEGGFDLLPIGLIDTHFSERDRLFRLIRLLSDSGLSTGYGVDENTALHVRQKNGKNELVAIGESGVWAVNNISNSEKTNTTNILTNTKQANVSLNANVTVLHNGSAAKIENLSWLGKNIVAEMLINAASNKQLKSKKLLKRNANLANASIKLDDASLSFQINITLEN